MESVTKAIKAGMRKALPAWFDVDIVEPRVAIISTPYRSPLGDPLQIYVEVINDHTVTVHDGSDVLDSLSDMGVNVEGPAIIQAYNAVAEYHDVTVNLGRLTVTCTPDEVPEAHARLVQACIEIANLRHRSVGVRENKRAKLTRSADSYVKDWCNDRALKVTFGAEIEGATRIFKVHAKIDAKNPLLIDIQLHDDINAIVNGVEARGFSLSEAKVAASTALLIKDTLETERYERLFAVHRTTPIRCNGTVPKSALVDALESGFVVL